MNIKQNPNKAIAQLKQYQQELTAFMETPIYNQYTKATDMPAKREHATDTTKPMALRLKAYNIYYGVPAMALLNDTLRPLVEYGFEIAPWNLEYAFNNEKKVTEAIKIGKELTQTLKTHTA